MRQSEKRVFPRVAVTLTAHCRIGNRFVRDAVVDLSEGGLYLKTREPAREGTPVRVAIALPALDGVRFCTLVGSVARVDRDAKGSAKGLGVSFSGQDITLSDRETLTGFVRARAAA
ncbi:MAG: PilZ domain-containing protein [Myxococcales bacterium]|nr:PilZ domain-containing protein [Myxococcales bacterium]